MWEVSVLRKRGCPRMAATRTLWHLRSMFFLEWSVLCFLAILFGFVLWKNWTKRFSSWVIGAAGPRPASAFSRNVACCLTLCTNRHNPTHRNLHFAWRARVQSHEKLCLSHSQLAVCPWTGFRIYMYLDKNGVEIWWWKWCWNNNIWCEKCDEIRFRQMVFFHTIFTPADLVWKWCWNGVKMVWKWCENGVKPWCENGVEPLFTKSADLVWKWHVGNGVKKHRDLVWKMSIWCEKTSRFGVKNEHLVWKNINVGVKMVWKWCENCFSHRDTCKSWTPP